MQSRNVLATSPTSTLSREAFDVKVSTSGRKVADWIMRTNDLSPVTRQLHEPLVNLDSQTNMRGLEFCNTMIDNEDAAYS